MRFAHPRTTAALAAGLLIAVSASLVHGCSEVPIRSLDDSFAVQVFDRRENKNPAKIDFLWVIDNSSSMCEEQANLAKNFQSFVSTLNTFINIDARMAVVNTNVLSDHAGFNVRPASAFPPPCRRQVIKKCLSDEDCLIDSTDGPGLTVPPGNSRWICNWTGKPPSTLENQNGSINSRCLLECDATSSCASVFSEDFICKEFEANITEPGCMVPPPTATCPDASDLRPVLEIGADGQNIDLFQCIATVGADPSFNANLEQGLNAARFALDLRGPNQEQARAFMRDDAWLVLIFVSDEDDCSLTRSCLIDGDGAWRNATDVKDCIPREQYNTCALLGDTNEGGPLEPVSRYVNFFKSLKDDPSRVVVASIVGDSRASDPAERDADRQAYMASESAQQQFATNTYICSSDNGIADFGQRYVRLVEAFGTNGILANICGPSPCTLQDGADGFINASGQCQALEAGEEVATLGVKQALELISETIIRRVVRICLPLPIEECAEVDPDDPENCLQPAGFEVVRRTQDGQSLNLSKAPGAVAPGQGQYQIEDDSLCGNTQKAIFFGDLLDPQDSVEIRYAGQTDSALAP